MSTYQVGYFVGSLSSTSINRILSRALIRLAPADLEFTEIPIGDLPLYSPDFDADYPAEARALKEAIAGVGAVLFVTPGVQPLDPRRAEERHRLGVPPWGQNSFNHMPAAVIGASPGQIGTALAQQSLRGVLSFCNARQMTSPEAYISFRPGLSPTTARSPTSRPRRSCPTSWQEFRDHIERVLTVLPRDPEMTYAGWPSGRPRQYARSRCPPGVARAVSGRWRSSRG